MNKTNLVIVLIALLTLSPTIYIGFKGASLFSRAGELDAVKGFESFAQQVESGSLTYAEISSRLWKIAKAEKQISRGLDGIVIGWLMFIGALTILQAMSVRMLLNTLNNDGAPYIGFGAEQVKREPRSCPVCNLKFVLTWSKYLKKSVINNHKCNGCQAKLKLKPTTQYHICMIAIVMVFIVSFQLIYINIPFDSFKIKMYISWGVLLFTVFIPIEKYCQSKLDVQKI